MSREIRRTVTVHDFGQALAVLQWAENKRVGIDLMSPRGGCRTHGAGYYHFIGRQLNCPLLIDCGDHAGDVLACIQLRAPRILACCRPDVQTRLASMCAKAGLDFQENHPKQLLELQCDDESCEIARRLSYETGNLKS